MKKTLAIILSMLLIMSTFSGVYAEDYVGATLIGKDTIIGTGTATVDVEVTFTTQGVSTLDSIYFKAIPDAGLTMKSVTIPDEYAKYADLTNDSFVRNNIIWISNSNYSDLYEAAETATFIITYEIMDPETETTYNIDICEEVAMFDTLQCSTIEVAKDATVTVKSSDATLSDIFVDGMTVTDFAPEVTDYEITVANDVTEVAVDAAANNAEATFEVEGGSDLVVGENIVTVTTTAADGMTQLVYTITVVRAPSEDATLSDLTVAGETIEGFAADVYDYTLNVANDVTELEIDAITNHDEATFEVVGGKDFVVGENEVIVTVTAEDGETTLDYVITVVRAPSTDTTLADLTIDGVTIEGFEPEKEYYEIVVSNDTTELQVGVVPSHENATYVIEGNTDFTVGENEIIVTVTAEDGETVYYYTIMVSRQPSSDATLSEILVNGVSIGELAPETFEYMIDVDYLTKEIVVEATANHEAAEVSVSETGYVELGENIVKIFVTAEDGVTISEYTLTIIRPEAPVNPVEANIVDNESGEAPYETYTINELPDGIIEITIEALEKHQDRAGVEGYWAGFAVVAPVGATSVRYAFVAEDIENAEPVILETLEENVDGNGNAGIMFLTDVKEETPKTFVALQWLDADGDPLTGVIKYELDLTNITFAEIVLVDGVNAEISEVVADASMTDEIGTIYTVKITDETIADKVPVAFCGDEVVGTTLYSIQRNKYVVTVPADVGEVTLKAVATEETSVTEFIYGDIVGNDSAMNSNDVQTITVRLKGIADNVNTTAKMIAADVDGNGTINSNDVQAMKVSIKGIASLAILSR